MSNEQQNSTSMAKVIYILLLISTIIGITGIIALIMAYVMKDEAGDVLLTHYRFQIRTFWIGLVYTMTGAFLLQFIIGYLILLFTFIWVVVRCAKGLRWLEQYQPVADVETWLF